MKTIPAMSPHPLPRGLWAGPISREPLRAAPREETRGLPGGDRWEAANVSAVLGLKTERRWPRAVGSAWASPLREMHTELDTEALTRGLLTEVLPAIAKRQLDGQCHVSVTSVTAVAQTAYQWFLQDSTRASGNSASEDNLQAMRPCPCHLGKSKSKTQNLKGCIQFCLLGIYTQRRTDWGLSTWG